jgi:hypothetical protein
VSRKLLIKGQTDIITAQWDGTNWVEVRQALNVSYARPN